MVWPCHAAVAALCSDTRFMKQVPTPNLIWAALAELSHHARPLTMQYLLHSMLEPAEDVWLPPSWQALPMPQHKARTSGSLHSIARIMVHCWVECMHRRVHASTSAFRTGCGTSVCSTEHAVALCAEELHMGLEAGMDVHMGRGRHGCTHRAC